MEAVLGSLLLGIRWDIPRSQEFVDECLVLADTPTEHATVVAVVVHAPLHIDDLTWRVGHDRVLSPYTIPGSVVINADAGIVAARTTPTNGCSGKIWPRGDGLENVALGAAIKAGL